MTRAIIYVPSTDYEKSASRCLDYVKRQGYEFVGIVREWSEVQRMLGEGEVSVALVADERDLDPNRKPRIEIVANQPEKGGRFERRTRMIRRNEAR